MKLVFYVLMGIFLIIALISYVISSSNQGTRNFIQMPKKNDASKHPPTMPLSAWEWRFNTAANVADLTKDFSTLSTFGISTIYIDANDLVDIAELPDSASKTTQTSAFYSQLAAYITAARAENIEVHVLFSGKDWTLSSHQYLNTIAIDAVIAYNAQAPDEAKITGIHFDHEPFSLAAFENDQVAVLENYLAVFDQITQQLTEKFAMSSNMKLGVDAPAWLDGQHGNINQILWNGETMFPIYHLLDILDTYGNSELVLMAYRNQAGGENGVIQFVTDELEYAQANSLQVDIVVGQELNDEEPQTITYFGKDWQYVLNSWSEIDTGLKNYPNYKGIAVHEVYSYLDLIQTD